jgi:hypothetical protein
MDVNEMSNQFDVLFNNVTSNQAPGLNEFEKSVFLTKAQDMLLIEYYNGRVDGVGGGFDGSQKRQYDFSSLIKTVRLSVYDNSEYAHVDKRSVLYLFPEDYFLAVNETLADNSYQYTVIPLSYDEYSRLMMKPYAFPVKRAVWRLFTGYADVNHSQENSVTHHTVAEIIGKPTMDMEEGEGKDDLSDVYYVLRYVRKPNPIILDNLSTYGDNVTIDGRSAPMGCELPPETHQEVLERAVTLAKIAWQGGTVTQAVAQQRNDN